MIYNLKEYIDTVSGGEIRPIGYNNKIYLITENDDENNDYGIWDAIDPNDALDGIDSSFLVPDMYLESFTDHLLHEMRVDNIPVKITGILRNTAFDEWSNILTNNGYETWAKTCKNLIGKTRSMSRQELENTLDKPTEHEIERIEKYEDMKRKCSQIYG